VGTLVNTTAAKIKSKFYRDYAGKRLAGYALAVEPRFELYRHISLLCERLEEVAEGKILRLMLSMPPQHGKSLLLRIFAAWLIGQKPELQIILTGYASDLTNDGGRLVRQYLRSAERRVVFPRCLIDAECQAVDHVRTTRGGNVYAVGKDAVITGRRADFLLIDDPIKSMTEAQSETERKSLHAWYNSVLLTRLAPKGRIVLVGTRWNEDDLHGRILREKRSEWVNLRLPAFAEDDDAFRQEGEALCPELYSREVLLERKNEVGPTVWATSYQQSPDLGQDAVFQRGWFQYYDAEKLPAEWRYRLISLDTALKTGSKNSYSVATVWGVHENKFYVLGVLRGRWQFPELKSQVLEVAERFKPNVILIEEASSGGPLIAELKVGCPFGIKPISPGTDKYSRASAVSVVVSTGRVYLPNKAPWVDDFVNELCSFPNSAFDDQVDSFSQALDYLRSIGGNNGSAQAVFIAQPRSIDPTRSLPHMIPDAVMDRWFKRWTD
jgi:predicted phage terminase large subunit-like protein